MGRPLGRAATEGSKCPSRSEESLESPEGHPPKVVPAPRAFLTAIRSNNNGGFTPTF